MSSEDIVGVSFSLLTFNYFMFARSHVPDISLSNIHFDLTIEDELPEVPHSLVLPEEMFCWN